jgi:hypothetical protein
MDEERMNNYKGLRVIGRRGRETYIKEGQRKGRHDTCNMIGSKF